MDEKILSILKNSSPTSTPGIFENIRPDIDPNKPFLFILTGPTGSGKSTFLRILADFLNRVKTATTRSEMREDEDENSFVWLKESRLENESDVNYKKRIQEKYKLLETNLHAGNVYGTPEEEMEKSLNKGNSIISVENSGARVLRAKLAHQANIITFFVLPDSKEELIKRVGQTRNDLEERMEVAEREIKTSDEFTNYYIHNTEKSIYSGNENPLEYTENSLAGFIKKLINYEN